MDVRRPRITLALAAATTALLINGCSSAPETPATPISSASAAASVTATTPPKGIPEDPTSIVKASDLRGLAGVCLLTEAKPLGAQGVESTYRCDTVTLMVVELNGEQVKSDWAHLSQRQSTPLPDVGKDALLLPGTGVAVLKDAGDNSASVSVMAAGGPTPLDDGALKQLAEQIAKRIKA
jgi:hypothetical protein